MGVVTTADERLKAAKRSLQETIASLSDIVVQKCWGHDEYTPEYRQTLNETFRDLLEVQERIGSP